MFRPTFVALAAVCVALAGCGPTARQADPDAARAALRQALDAWKKGESPESLKAASSPVTVADQQWARGAKLIDYELSDKTTANGFDQRFTATLTLADPAGKKTQKVAYDVSTHPSLVVVRAEGP